jgi:hypothetical protein
MDSMPTHRTSWKIRLVAFGIGIIVAAAIFGIALVISDDLRLLYLSGGSLLGVAAFLLTAKAREDWIAAVLLLFASTFLFAFFVLPQTPLLWPTLLLWAAIVSLLAFRNRFGKTISIGGASILVAVSAWYCVFYIPVQMQRALTRVSNGAAPPHFATHEPGFRADWRNTGQNSRARFFCDLVFSMYRRAAGTGAHSRRSTK